MRASKRFHSRRAAFTILSCAKRISGHDACLVSSWCARPTRHRCHPRPNLVFCTIPQNIFSSPKSPGIASAVGTHKNNASITRLRQRGCLFTTTDSCSKRARSLCLPTPPQNIILLRTCLTPKQHTRCSEERDGTYTQQQQRLSTLLMSCSAPSRSFCCPTQQDSSRAFALSYTVTTGRPFASSSYRKRQIDCSVTGAYFIVPRAGCHCKRHSAPHSILTYSTTITITINTTLVLQFTAALLYYYCYCAAVHRLGHTVRKKRSAADNRGLARNNCPTWATRGLHASWLASYDNSTTQYNTVRSINSSITV